MADSKLRTDKILNENWDVVVSNGVVKAGMGFTAGVVASVLLRRRAWPVIFGTGFGAGIGWSEGDATFKNAYKADAGKRSLNA